MSDNEENHGHIPPNAVCATCTLLSALPWLECVQDTTKGTELKLLVQHSYPVGVEPRKSIRYVLSTLAPDAEAFENQFVYERVAPDSRRHVKSKHMMLVHPGSTPLAGKLANYIQHLTGQVQQASQEESDG